MANETKNEMITRARKNPDCYDVMGAYVGPGAELYGSTQTVDENGEGLTYEVEIETEDDGRILASISSMPGVMAYGSTEAEAREKVLRVAEAVR